MSAENLLPHPIDPLGNAVVTDGVEPQSSTGEEANERAKHILHQPHAQFETLFNNAPLGIYIVDADFRIREVNPIALPVFGTIENVIGRDFDEVMHILWPKEYADEVVAIFRHTLESGECYVLPERTEDRLDRQTTECYEWEIHRIPLPDARDGVACYFRDISGKVHTRNALNKSERSFRALVTASPDAMYRTNADWREMHQLKRQTPDTGFLVEALESNPDWMVDDVDPGDLERVKDAIRVAIRTKGVFELEHRVRQVDGSVVWVSSRAVPVLDEAGNIREWFGTASDVTHRKISEAALMNSEKLAAVGRLASTIAHEVNNPLEAVMNIIWLLQRDRSLSLSAREYLKTADEELARVAHLIQQTLSFSSGGIVPRPLRFSELVEDVLMMFAPRIRNKDATLIEEVETNVSLTGVSGELRQVLANLISNSLDAIPIGGSIWVRACHATQNNKAGMRLTIADNGAGIPEAGRHQVFEPFFSSKGSTGVGLGLWIAANIVRKHHGTIQVRSSTTPGRSWTVFSVFLPEIAAASAMSAGVPNSKF